MGTHRLFKKRPNLEFDKKTEEQRHYENIISFFKWSLGITGTFFLVILTAAGILFFKDRHDLNDDIKSYLKESKDQIREMTNEARGSLNDTKNQYEHLTNELQLDAERNLSEIRNEAKILAINTSQKKVIETFKENNIQQIIDDAAKRSIDERVNQYIEKKVNDAESEIYTTIETSLRLSGYMDLMFMGNREGLDKLQKIAEKEPNTKSGLLANKIIKIKSEDYREYFQSNYGENLSKYLDYLEIPLDIRKDKVQLVDTLIKIIEKENQGLHEIACATIALEKLGYGHFDVFNFNQISILKKRIK